MKNGKRMLWNLSFIDKNHENLFIESKKAFQKPALLLFMSSGLTISFLELSINPFDKQLFQASIIGFMIGFALLYLIIFFLSFKVKRWPLLEFLAIFQLLYFLIGAFETLEKETTNRWGRLYFFNVGGTIESLYFSLILTKVGWMKNIICFSVITVLTVCRYTPFEENLTCKFFPLIMNIKNFLLMCFISFISEKKEREQLQEIIDYESNIFCLKDLIKKFIPTAILILHKQNVVFKNNEAEKLFKSDNNEGIYKNLLQLKTFKVISSKDRNKSWKSSKNPESLASLKYENENDSLMEILFLFQNQAMNNSNSPITVEAFVRVESISEPMIYKIKLNQVLWDGNQSIMITFEESKILKKINIMKEKTEYKNNILATLSHDLRTPLYGIMGMIGITTELTADPVVRKNLTIALRTSKLMSLLINDILDYSQIALGEFRVNYDYFSLWDLIEEIWKLYKFQAKKKCLRFTKENKVEGGLQKSFIRTDQNRLKQVVSSFLSNAVKFTRKGFVNISIENAERQEDNSCETARKGFLVEIAYSGTDMPEEQVHNLFQDPGHLQEVKSNELNPCLGLAISRKILQELNKDPGSSQLKVESEEGKGSIFSFFIKSHEESNEEENFNSENDEFFNAIESSNSPPVLDSRNSKQSLSNSRPPAKETRILLVDDDQINIMVGSSYLRGLVGVQYDAAFNGEQALETIKKKAASGFYYDLILMDCNMPVMDGFKASIELRKLIAQKAFPDLCIIACTANASLEDKDKLLLAGIDDILIKPFSKEDLEKKIKFHLGIQLCSTGLVVLWFFVIIWSTFLLRYGLIGILLRSFKYTFSITLIYCLIFGIERAIRLMSFITSEERTDTIIWDQPEYRILFYLRHACSFLFYGLLLNSSVRLATPDYYKPKKWLK